MNSPMTEQDILQTQIDEYLASLPEEKSCEGSGQHQKGDGSWWEKDGQGIPLARVCDDCRKQKLSSYRPEILRGYTQVDVDEPIESEDDLYYDNPNHDY